MTEDAHEIVPNVFLGNYRVASHLMLLEHLGITHVVNCAKELPNYFNNSHIKYLKFSLDDTPDQDIASKFNEAFGFIDGAISQGGKVLVHCYAGISRSTTILSSYLAKKYHMKPTVVLQMIRNIRPIVRPNHGFAQQLLETFSPKSTPTTNLGNAVTPPTYVLNPFDDSIGEFPGYQ